MNERDLLWEAMRRPHSTVALDLAGWDLLVRQARRAKVLGRLAVILHQQDLLGQLPPKVGQHLAAARAVADKHARMIRWEVNRVRRALAGAVPCVVLLKGGAYLTADLPPARGRLYADLDVMVPKARLPDAERTLAEHGWESMKLHPYDDRYYRRWMHELPPLRHPARGTVLDLHHTILPETGRLHPDPEKLFAAARPLGDGPLKILAPVDMVLHSAAHLFQDGDLAGGLRDLTDLDDLLRHFAAEPDFWDRLVPRARELDLKRPLYYALRYTRRFLETPVPETVVTAAEAGRPARPVGSILNALVVRALEPEDPDKTRPSAALARWLLYVRSHWLRMPPWLLASHLARKALRRWYGEEKG